MKKNECTFYHINDSLEIVVDDKAKFNMEVAEPYNLEDLHTILDLKRKRNKLKDQADILKIEEYLKK